MNRVLLLFTLVCALIACTTQQVKQGTDTAVFVCDVAGVLTPEELRQEKIAQASDFLCAGLKTLKETGVIPAADPVTQREACAALTQTRAAETDGYKRICGEPLLTQARQSMTIYQQAAVGLIPGHRAFDRWIVFDQPHTDSVGCGEQSISGISMCGREAFMKPAQLYTYPDPETAVDYSVCHEEAHNIQQQKGLLLDYAEHFAFRELQGDCVCGALDATFDPTRKEIEEFENLMTAIGDLATHGTAGQRVEFYRVGLYGGLEECLAKTPV